MKIRRPELLATLLVVKHLFDNKLQAHREVEMVDLKSAGQIVSIGVVCLTTVMLLYQTTTNRWQLTRGFAQTVR